MYITSYAEAVEALRDHYDRHGGHALGCALGAPMIVHATDGMTATPSPGLLWVMGFNGGESDRPKDAAGNTPSANRWFNLCKTAAQTVGSSAWIIGERVHWGSPSVAELMTRVGSEDAFSELLAFHAEVNRALMRLYPPKVVWMTGLSTCMLEAVEDYRLRRIGGRYSGEKHRLWQVYRDDADIPWLATRHPTGAFMSRVDLNAIHAKLAELTGSSAG